MSRAATTEPPAVVADAASPQATVAADDSAFANAVEKTGAVAPAAVVELPLSPEEIETMTVDFVGAQVSAPAVEPLAEAAHDVPVPEVSQPDAARVSTMENALAFEPVLDAPTETSAVADEPLDADASQQAPAGFDFEAEAALDVDTEALSAMIDARLAEPESAQNQDPTQVWREVSGGAVPPAQQDQVSEAEPMTQDTPIPEPIPAPAAAAAVDDADVLASLPSLDDWALVDPDVAPAAAASSGARKSPEPALSEAFAGLELVPMETIVPLRVDADPIERWFGGDPGSKAGANDSIEPKMKEVSHEHG